MRKMLQLVLCVLFAGASGCDDLFGDRECASLYNFCFYQSLNGSAGLSSDVVNGFWSDPINVTVPFSADVSGLIASFTADTGSEVTVEGAAQTSGITRNDFSVPVSFRVSGKDYLDDVYTVTVVRASESAKEITAMSLQPAFNSARGISRAIYGSVKDDAIDFFVPEGTDVTALVMSFCSTGSSVSSGSAVQTSRVTQNDFTNPVVYTVTAADGSAHEYTVAVKISDSIFSYKLTENLLEITGLLVNRDSLRELVIPAVIDGYAVTSVGESALACCANLQTVTISSGLSLVGYGSFDSCRKLVEVNLPDTVERIDSLAFSGCESLTSITLPSSLESIGWDAFSYSGLTSILIPSGVTSIEDDAFHSCSSLTTVTCDAVNPPTIPADEYWVIFRDAPVAAIYVPSESLSAYKTAPGWSVYADIIFGK